MERHILSQKADFVISMWRTASIKAAMQAWKAFLVARAASKCQEIIASELVKARRMRFSWERWMENARYSSKASAALTQMQSW